MAKDAVPPTSLGGEINAATRSLHTNLNRLITSRLPLALPPYTTDSALYSTGLVHFAHIFLTFESLWTDLTPPTSPSAEPASPLLSFLLVNPYDNPDLFTSPPSPRMLAFLRTLRPQGLARSGRLKKDLEVLLGLHPTDFSVLLAQYPGDEVAHFCNHIRQQVGRKPHVLVAYAWCYYMAVFSGGRWIRGELVKAGPAFWLPDSTTATSEAEKGSTLLSQHGLSFWNFDGEADGEDVKAEFKVRLHAAEDFFSDDERIDVIEEAKEIFKQSAELVAELDELVGTDYEALKIVDAKQRMHIKRERETAQQVAIEKQAGKIGAWYERPEVRIGAFGLGLVACAAFLTLDGGSLF